MLKKKLSPEYVFSLQNRSCRDHSVSFIQSVFAEHGGKVETMKQDSFIALLSRCCRLSPRKTNWKAQGNKYHRASYRKAVKKTI